MNESFIAALGDKMVISVAVIVVIALLWYSIDIYLFFARKDFGNTNIYLAHFTRHDNRRERTDALQLRVIRYKMPLKKTYRNRVLFWRMIFVSMKATVDRPVLDFGKRAYAMLAPIRGQIASIYASMEIKRAAGFAFKENRYQIVVVYDRSENKRNYVLKIIVIREEDLRNFQQYVDNPPGAGENIDLMSKIAASYNGPTRKNSFLYVQVVAA